MKISELQEIDQGASLDEVYTIGNISTTDPKTGELREETRKVRLQFMEKAANKATEQAAYAKQQGDYAKQVGDTYEGRIGGAEGKITELESEVGQEELVEFTEYSSYQYRAYIRKSFKKGDVIDVFADGTASLSGGIIVKYDDESTNIAQISNDSLKTTCVLSKDTSYIVALLNKNNIVEEGTVTFHAVYGNRRTINETAAKVEALDEKLNTVGSKLHLADIYTHDGYLSVNGNIYQDAIYKTTGFIPYTDDVEVTSRVSKNRVKVAFYDFNFKFLSAAISESDYKTSFKIKNFAPDDVAYFRVTNNYVNTPEAEIVSNSLASISSLVDIIHAGINDKIGDIDAIRFGSNILKKGKRAPFEIKNGAYLNKKGQLENSEGLNYSDYISIKGCKGMQFPEGMLTGNACCLFYDKNCSIVKYVDSSNYTEGIAIDENVCYVRFSCVQGKNYFIPSEDGFINDKPAPYSLIESRLYKKGDDVLSEVIFTKGGFYKADGKLYMDSTTSYQYSDLIPIGLGSYSYNGTLSGEACIVFYNANKEVVQVLTSSDPISTIEVSASNIYYIGISRRTTTSLICNTDSIRKKIEHNLNLTAKKANDFITKEGKMVSIKSGLLGCQTFRLSFKFKIGYYVESVDSVPLVKLGDFFRLDVRGNANEEMSVVDGTYGHTTKYPIPLRKCYFGALVENKYYATPHRTLPKYKELIGDDLFSIRYIGSASENGYNIDNEAVQAEYNRLADKLYLTYTNEVLTIASNTTTYISENISGYENIGALVEYLKNKLPQFAIEMYCQSTTKVSSIADITKVWLVSHYKSVAVENGTLRADAFPCYFNGKIDNSVHTAEIVCDNGILYWVVDGVANDSNGRGYTKGLYFDSLTFGCNGDTPIEVLDWELNIGHIGDAEVVSDGRIISALHPSIILFMGHAMWYGDECDGKSPIFKDQSPNSNEAAVIPVKYKTYKTFLPSIAMSDKKFSKLCRLAKEKGYVHIPFGKVLDLTSGALPKRCWCVCFDDRLQWFFDDLEIRQVFGREKIRPTLAVSYDKNDIEGDLRTKIEDMKNSGWEVLMHGYEDVNVSCLSSTQLFDTTSSGILPVRSFNIQRTSAERVGINWANWVYANGSANPNTIKAFSHLGAEIGIMTSLDSNVNHAACPYYYKRTSISEKNSIRNIQPLFV